VVDDVPIDSNALLVTNFVNLKIKPVQSFGGARWDRVCVRVFVGVSAHTCMSICAYMQHCTVLVFTPQYLHTEYTWK
jgi:hypothetical protein